MKLRCIAIFGLAAVSATLSGARSAPQPPAGSPPESTAGSPANPVPSCEALAARVRDAYRELKYLGYEETVTHVRRTLVIQTRMTRDAFRTEVFEHGRLSFAIGMTDHQVTELLTQGGPGTEGRAPAEQIISYPTQRPDGPGDARLCDDEFGCMFGSSLATWIGPDAERPQRFFNMIESCQSVVRDRLDGRDCLKASFTDTVSDDGSGKPRTFENVYYVDPQTSLLIRWDSSQQQQGREKLQRTRLFRNVQTSPPQSEGPWTITAANVRRVQPGLDSPVAIAK